MSGQTCVQKVFTLWTRYGLQPVFCADRTEAAAYIVEAYEGLGRCWKTDRQATADLYGGLQMPLTEASFDD